MPNFGIGLPQMDLDAPRLLAHTHLFEIDALFDGDPDADYARYMDDINFGVDSIAKAKSVLRDLDLSLQTRNLRLNSGKTAILTAKEAETHYKVHENLFIEKIIIRLEEKYYLQYWLNFYGRLATKLLKSEKAKVAFSTGNGSKLIKRLLTIMRGTRTTLPDDVFKWLLHEHPGLRKELFQTWSKCGVTKNQIDRLTGFLASGEAIDDMSYILSINAMVQTLFRRKFTNVQFSYLRYVLKGNESSHLYSRLLFVSRFDTASLLWSEIKNTVGIWSRQKFLSRQVAGFAPLLFHSTHWLEYSDLVRRWAGDDGMSVFEFHSSLRQEPTAVKAVSAFLKAPNPSSGTEISHAKTLMVMSVIQNSKMSKLERAKFVGQHSTMMNDIYYQTKFSFELSNMP